MHYSLRRAGPDDETQVTSLLKASFPPMLAEFYDEEVLERALPVMTVANPDLLSSRRYYVAETSGKAVVGCGGWSFDWPGSGRTVPAEAHIRQYAVHPDWTRRGIATALNRRCFVDAKDCGVELIHCYASLGSEPFYVALGFETVGTRLLELSNGVSLPITHMRCEVDALLGGCGRID